MDHFDPAEIFSIRGENHFSQLALRIFRHQAEHNETYKEYISYLGIDPLTITNPESVPYMPVEFFRSRRIVTGTGEAEKIFISSGTTAIESGRHFVTDLSLYIRSFLSGFEVFYGRPEDYVIISLLPSYLEREGSSLVFMANGLIELSASPLSGFLLGKEKDIPRRITMARESGKKVLLLGVTFALLDLAEKGPFDFSGITVMETGGMKGRREEITREEVHNILCSAFNLEVIHSEYGMTEMLSQAYSNGRGVFRPVPWVRILIRDAYDPGRHYRRDESTAGGIDIIDLANVNSCSFISTGDIGRAYPDGSFTVLGRFDSAQLRGCNLMIL